MINKKIQRYCIAIVILLVVGIIWQISQKVASPFQTKLSTMEKIKVEELLNDLKTSCIGRYLIDLPSSYTAAEISRDRINDLTIITTRMYPPSFEQRISLREKEIRSTKIVEQENMPYLKKIHSLPNGMKGVIFERGKGEIKPDAFRVFEAHMYDNGVAFEIESAFINASDKRYDLKREVNPDVYINNSEEKFAELTDLLLRIKGRTNNEIPTAPGTCIQNAFIADNGKDKEDINILFKDGNDKSQLRFGISTDNFTQEKDSLLERSNTIAANILPSNGSILRKGARKINQLETEELLAIGDYSSSSNKRYDFILLTNEKIGGYKTPVFALELLNAEWTPSPYNLNEIISFWDAISQTVRLRPGAF